MISLINHDFPVRENSEVVIIYPDIYCIYIYIYIKYSPVQPQLSQHFQAIFGLIPDRNLAVNSPKKTINSLVVLTILKNSSQWEGLSHILWNIKNVPNLQPEYIYIYNTWFWHWPSLANMFPKYI